MSTLPNYGGPVKCCSCQALIEVGMECDRRGFKFKHTWCGWSKRNREPYKYRFSPRYAMDPVAVDAAPVCGRVIRGIGGLAE